MENNMKVSQKTKSWTVLWPNNSTSGNLLKDNKTTSLKRYLHPHVHCSLTYNSQNMETA